MQNLREVLKHAQEEGAAAGHFKIADLVLLKAVFAAAREANAPVLVGASEGDAKSLSHQVAASESAGPY
jgi:fructose-bisphosphate aldolase class II